MVALFICSIILACFNEQTPIETARGYLLHEPHKAIAFMKTRSPQEQIYIITALSEELPQKITPLCPILGGEGKERCMRIAQRPHLWEVSTSDQAPSKDHDCAHPHLCRESEAIQLIHTRSFKEAKKSCAAISSSLWRQECFFHCAETLLEKDITRYSDALSFCEESGSFRNNCIQHGIFRIASYWIEEKYNITQVQQQMQALHTVWNTHHSEEAFVRIDQLWAHWMYRYMETHPLTPEQIPSDLSPHYRNIKALWGVQFAKALNSNLEQHIQKRQNDTLRLQKQRRGLDPMMNLWFEKPSNDVRSYLGYSFRHTDLDPMIDELIATLESLARIQPPQTNLIAPYRNHPHPKVQQTATRLLRLELGNPQPYHRPVQLQKEGL